MSSAVAISVADRSKTGAAAPIRNARGEIGFVAAGRTSEASAGEFRTSTVGYDPVEAGRIGAGAAARASLSIAGTSAAGAIAANAGVGSDESVSRAWPVGD